MKTPMNPVQAIFRAALARASQRNQYVQEIFQAARIAELKYAAGIVKPQPRPETDEEKARRSGFDDVEAYHRFLRALKTKLLEEAAAAMHACDAELQRPPA